MNHSSRSVSFASPIFLGLALAGFAHTPMAGGKHAGGHDQSAIGEPGQPASVTRTVQIDMSDAMRYTPSNIDARQGETIRFVITNSGKLKHELVLGTEKELKEHHEAMKKFPEMEHDDPNMVTVAPGQRGEVIWKFTQAGRINFACLQPGHFDAGMKGAVAVAAGKGAIKNVGGASTAAFTRTAAPAAQDRAAASREKAGDIKISQAAPAADTSDGEVRKIDAEGGKLTLKHGEIKNLDMPGMTMVFVVKDKAMLDTLKVGDRVKFRAVNEGGKFVLTEVQPAR